MVIGWDVSPKVKEMIHEKYKTEKKNCKMKPILPIECSICMCNPFFSIKPPILIYFIYIIHNILYAQNYQVHPYLVDKHHYSSLDPIINQA